MKRIGENTIKKNMNGREREKKIISRVVTGGRKCNNGDREEKRKNENERRRKKTVTGSEIK